MEARKLLSNRKYKATLEDYLTTSFKDFRWMHKIDSKVYQEFKVVNVDVLTLVSDKTSVFLAIEDVLAKDEKNRYYTTKININDKMDIVLKKDEKLYADGRFLEDVLNEFKKEFIHD